MDRYNALEPGLAGMLSSLLLTHILSHSKWMRVFLIGAGPIHKKLSSVHLLLISKGLTSYIFEIMG